MLKNENIEIVKKFKLLGTIFTDRLTWSENCQRIIRKVNMRLQFLTKCFSFGASKQEMVKLWVTYCRSILEQSCVVWNGSLTNENINDLERTQKTFCKLIFQNNFETYEKCLEQLNIEKHSEKHK